MTLVYREEKKDAFQPNKNQLGPGYYDLPSPPKLSQHHAPFNSSNQRSLFQESQSRVGPGVYETAKDFITKQNPSGYIFKSQIERFRHSVDNFQKQNRQQVKLNIGKSEDNPNKVLSVRKSTVVKPRTVEDRMEKFRTIPSIPTLKQSFGYQMNQRDELILNKNPRDIMSKLDQYRQNANRAKKQPKGCNWSKSKIQRQPFVEKNSSSPPPNTDKSPGKASAEADPGAGWQSKKVFKYTATENIKSEQRKIALLKLRYQQKFSRYYIKGKQHELIDAKLARQSLGPGYYDIDRQTAEKYVQKQGSFGSMIERFPSPSYETNAPIKPYKDQRQDEVGTNSMTRFTCLPLAQRFKRVGNAHHVPGPGTYTIKQAQQQSRGVIFSKQRRFNSKPVEAIQDSVEEYSFNSPKGSNNFQKFQGPNHAKPRVQSQTKDAQLVNKFSFIISSDNAEVNQKENVRALSSGLVPKPKKQLCDQQTLMAIKQNIKKLVEESSVENQLRETRLQGKAARPRFNCTRILEKQKQRRGSQARKVNLGPGAYNTELKYGKGTFNVTYT